MNTLDPQYFAPPPRPAAASVVNKPAGQPQPLPAPKQVSKEQLQKDADARERATLNLIRHSESENPKDFDSTVATYMLLKPQLAPLIRATGVDPENLSSMDVSMLYKGAKSAHMAGKAQGSGWGEDNSYEAKERAKREAMIRFLVDRVPADKRASLAKQYGVETPPQQAQRPQQNVRLPGPPGAPDATNPLAGAGSTPDNSASPLSMW